MLIDEMRATGYRFLDTLVTGHEEEEHITAAKKAKKPRKTKPRKTKPPVKAKA